MNDIFSFDNLSDLDASVIDKIQIINNNNFKILSLFRIKNELTIDEVIIGLARKFDTHLSRGNVMLRLHKLADKKVLVRKKRGIYVYKKK